MMNGVSQEDLARWYQAQGLSEQDVEASRRAAFISGLATPTGAFLGNALQYIAVPWTSS